MHTLPAQLRFNDVDRFGHVNNAVYFTLFDTAKTAYFTAALGPDVFDKIAIVVAHVDADFLAPVYYPDEIVIETQVVKLGNKSFTLEQRAVNTRTHDVKCRCTTIMVCLDQTTKQSEQLPDFFRQGVKQYEGM